MLLVMANKIPMQAGHHLPLYKNRTILCSKAHGIHLGLCPRSRLVGFAGLEASPWASKSTAKRVTPAEVPLPQTIKHQPRVRVARWPPSLGREPCTRPKVWNRRCDRDPRRHLSVELKFPSILLGSPIESKSQIQPLRHAKPDNGSNQDSYPNRQHA